MLLLPAAYLGYHLALIGGMVVHALAESFCPPEAVVSGLCSAAYFRQVEKVLSIVFPGIAAVLVVLLPSVIAPTRKTAVAAAFLLLGGSVAVYLAAALHEWVALVFALICGGVTALAVLVHQKKAP